MDASFDPTVIAGAGWNTDADTTQAQGSASSFDRVPLPIEIKDVLACDPENDKVHFGGYSFGTLRICGRIITKEDDGKDIRLTVCDPSVSEQEIDFHDERLTVIVYQSAAASGEYNVNDIIVALGKVRTFDGVVSFVAFGVTTQPDASLAETFKMEAKLAKYFYTANIPDRLSTGPCFDYEGTVFSNVPFVRQSSTAHAYPNAAIATNRGDTATSNSYTDSTRGLTGLKQQILTAVRNLAAEESGAHVSTILNAVGANAPNFNTELQYLLNEGILYNTIDDEHFAAI